MVCYVLQASEFREVGGGGCNRGRSTEPVKSPLPLLPACNTLLINKLSHFSCTQYQGVEWCSWYLNIMKYVIRHAQLEVKKYNVLVRSFQACWLKHLMFYFHLCMSYRTDLDLILHTGTSKNFGENTHFKKTSCLHQRSILSWLSTILTKSMS